MKSWQLLGGAATLLALVLLASPAQAERSVFLNGVKIDGLTNQEFKGATVRLDSDGNIHIDAKGYEVKRLGGEAEGTPVQGPPVAETYFLVATETNPKKIQWDVEVFIGNQLAGSIKWDGGQVVKDISSFLKQGENEVHFRARRNSDKPRISLSPADKLTIIIGTGEKRGNQVVITKPLVTFVRTAAEDAPVDRAMKFKAR